MKQFDERNARGSIMLDFYLERRKFKIPRAGVDVDVAGISYRLFRLSDKDPSVGMNVNSWVFKAKPRIVQQEDAGDEFDEYIAMKICFFSSDDNSWKGRTRRQRFYREIEAMRRVNHGDSQDRVLSLYDDFEIDIRYHMHDGSSFIKKHAGYLMEYADSDLGNFLTEEMENVPFSQRVILCADVLRSLKWLHDHGVYHRDIKPNNFFMVGGKCKIGDLGLIRNRGEDDASVDGQHERIGPIALMTPEAINKAYSIRTDRCWSVGEKSDIYQIAKLIWFILQFDIPNGIIKVADFVAKPDLSQELFGNVFRPALQYDETTRPTIGQVCNSFELVMRRYLS